MPSSANVIRLQAPLKRAALTPEEIAAAARQDEIETIRQEAYQKGFMDATAFSEKQVAEQRAEMIQLVEETFKSLADQRDQLWQQVGNLLPQLATEIARRVLCNLEPDRERMERAVEEVLSEIAPGTRDVEIAMNPADLELLDGYSEGFRHTYPGLTFLSDEKLKVGDCRLKSGFGLVDATVATKLENISRSLH